MKSNILNYNYEKFDFRKFFVKNSKTEIDIYYKDFKKKKLLEKVKLIKQNNKFREFYKNFVKYEIQKLFSYEIAFQKYPNIRILMPKDVDSVVPFHCDKWYNHSTDEVNFWIPLHSVSSSESIQFVNLNRSKKIEKKIFQNNLNYNLIDKLILKYANPINCKFGEMLKFSPLHLHGNVINQTQLPRISIDFRIKKLNSKFTKKILGGYFEIF